MSIKTNFKKELKIEKGAGYTAGHAGDFSELHMFEFEHPRSGRNVAGKLFLREPLQLTGMQVSLNKLPKGGAMPFYHKHQQNEELYIFTGGQGQVQIDGDVIEVRQGTCIRMSPDAERTWRNTGDEDLYYVVIQAKENSLMQETFEDGVPVDRPVEW